MKKRYLLSNITLFVVLFSSASQISYGNRTTTLHKLLKNENLEVAKIEQLITNDTDVNLQNVRGNTYLHCLFHNFGHKDFDSVTSLFALLLEHGADVNKANVQNETPIGCLYYLIQQANNEEFRQNIHAIVEQAIEGGLNLNASCYGSKTLFCLACRINDVSLLKLLLNYAISDEQKLSLYEFAVNNRDNELKEILSPCLERKDKEYVGLTESGILNKYYEKYNGLTQQEIAQMDREESGSSSSNSVSSDNITGSDISSDSQDNQKKTENWSCVMM